MLRAAAAVVLALALAAAAAGQASAFDPDLPELCNTREFSHYKVQRAGSVRVLYRKRDRAAARRIGREAGGRIYPKFKKLLGRVPPSDAREGCFHGPDGKLDIYVTRAREIGHLDIPKNVLALVHPYDPDKGCDPKQPVYAIVRPNVRKAVLAHEIFHAFQAAYKTAQRCDNYGEWEEALATWAGNYVYPRDDIEHDHLGTVEQPATPMSLWGYSAWTFPYYVTQRFGAKVVRAIEEAKEKFKPDEHVDRAIPGKFAQRFPEFSLYAYNQSPLPNVPGIGASLRQWDRIAKTPKSVPVVDLALGGAHTANHPVPVDKLRVLSREYRRITISDPKVRQIQFFDPQAASPDLHVRAFVLRADGSWRAENWDGRATVGFCRDVPDQDVREIVLAYSNSAYARTKIATSTSFRTEDTCSMHYKVLSASINYHTDAKADSILCGTQSGRITFGGTGGEQFPAGNSLTKRNGEIDGYIGGRVTGSWSGHHLDGCKLSGPDKGPCSVDTPPRAPMPDGTKPIGFSVSGGADDDTWTLYWGMDDPEVGFVDAGDDECNVHIWGSFDYASQLRTVPRATMLSTEPITLSFRGSAVAPNTPNNTNATVAHSWDYTLTIQRVGPDGAPLG